jgi:inner membrane protein involved in colicin E2 resistance
MGIIVPALTIGIGGNGLVLVVALFAGNWVLLVLCVLSMALGLVYLGVSISAFAAALVGTIVFMVVGIASSVVTKSHAWWACGRGDSPKRVPTEKASSQIHLDLAKHPSKDRTSNRSGARARSR